MPLDPEKVQALSQKIMADLGGAVVVPLVLIGDKLGLYKALAARGPMTAAELAQSTSTHERYVREWLSAQAAAGFVNYDAATQRFLMSEEQATVFTAEDSPFFAPGGFELAAAFLRDESKLSDAFRSGKGVGWGEHDPLLFRGTERFFRPGYIANLTTSWIPALEGMEEKLRKGASVADIGCGHGASTIEMAKAYPNSEFHGFDFHAPSIERARELAREAGLSDRVTFRRASARDYDGTYDLVAFFDCLHDMGDPPGVAGHVRATLRSDGTWMVVEPAAEDDLAGNLGPFGRIAYCASTMVCTGASLAQEVGMALGAQAGPARLTEVIKAGGFSRVRIAVRTPINMIFEARP